MESTGDVCISPYRPRLHKPKSLTIPPTVSPMPQASSPPSQIRPHASLLFNEAGHAQVHHSYQFTRRIYESPASPGVVDLYKHADSGHEIVIKRTIKGKMCSSIQTNSASRELVVHRELVHSHIVHLLDAGENEEEFILAMEFVEDYDYFRNRLEVLNKPFYVKLDGGVAKMRSFSFDILTALDYLHASKVLHLDLKPSNLLLDRRVGETEYPLVKLCDFGLSRRIETNGSAYIEKRCGTDPYIAPEVRDHSSVTTAADMWSFGILLYQMIVGFVPTALKWKPGEPVPFTPRYWRKYADTGITDLISQCLRLNPTERITAAAALQHRCFSLE